MDIHYRFVSSGARDVERDFESIEKRAIRQKQAVEQSTRATRQATSRAPAERAEARPRISETERLARSVAAAQEREEKRARAAIARSAEQDHRKELQAVRRRHDEKIRETRRAAKQEEAARERAQQERAAKRTQSIGVLKDLAGGAVLGAVGTGAALIGAAAKESMQLQEAAARIAISARGAGQKAVDPNELRREFERTAINSPGQTGAGVADAVARFVSLTGNLDTARKSQGTFATIASASGANIGDVAEAAASLSQQFDITGLEDMREALAALTFQGKNGAFELKDAAAQFQRLAASGAAFGIPKGVGGVKVLGGLTQIARSGTGSPEQAATAVENLLTNLKVKQKQLGAADVDVFDKTGKARDVRDVVIDAISKVGGGDMAKKSAGLANIFGEQGIRAINPLVAKYSDTFRNTQGTEAQKTAAAVARLREEFTKAIDAPGTYADAQEDAAMAQKQSSAQLTAAWEQVKSKTADSLVPGLTKLAEGIGKNADALNPFIEAIGLSVDVLGEFVGFLKDSGIIKEKQKTNVEKEKDARAALDQFDRQFTEQGALTDAQWDQREKLAAAVDNANADVWGGGRGPTTAEDFVSQYQAAGGPGATREAAELAGKAVRGEALPMFNNDWFQSTFAGENQAQADLRHQYGGEVAGQKGAPSLNTKDAQQEIANFSAVVAAAAKRIAAGQQGNVITG